MKILFLIPYPTESTPSQRFRFEQYFDLLKSRGHELMVKPFLSAAAYNAQRKKNTIAFALYIVIGFARRIKHMLQATTSDFVFIHREAAPLGPPIIEWMLAKVLRKKIILDFDDAIWLTDNPNESLLVRRLKSRNKTATICRMSYKVSCGNKYLQSFALKYNPDAVLNPTTIDTTNHYHRDQHTATATKEEMMIVWTGSRTTLKYFTLLEDVLLALEQKYSHVRFRAIADEQPASRLTRFEFIKWSPQGEVPALLPAGIGIMPLPDDEWSKGKCALKALQYMALGIPTVASAVGANNDVIHHEVNGMLATDNASWTTCLEALINDSTLRRKLGDAGQQTVEQYYSTRSNSDNFLSLFR